VQNGVTCDRLQIDRVRRWSSPGSAGAISASGQGGVLVHVDPGRSGDLVATTRATTAVMQGREMPGWLRVSPEDLASDDDLSGWVETGVGRARSLPPKQPAKKQPKS
jgi:hypothetical protein